MVTLITAIALALTPAHAYAHITRCLHQHGVHTTRDNGWSGTAYFQPGYDINVHRAGWIITTSHSETRLIRVYSSRLTTHERNTFVRCTQL